MSESLQRRQDFAFFFRHTVKFISVLRVKFGGRVGL